MFKNNQKLKLFELISNKILILQNILLPPNITIVCFKNCSIQKLSEDLFKNSTSIQQLELSNNKLISLPKDIFVNQIMLRFLDLSRNQIMNLSDGLFDTTLFIKYIFLNRNKLTSITSPWMDLHPYLKIDLSYNNINSLESSNIFEHLVNLKFLLLVNVPTPEGIFDKMNQLTDLEIHSKRTKNPTAEVFKNQKKLMQLRLGCTADSVLDPLIFTMLPNLENLEINGNCLKSWPENMFKTNQKLKSFELRGNKILFSQKMLVPVNLIKGSFTSCNIRKLPKNLFKKSTVIEELDLSYNKLISLPKDIFVNQIMLSDLDLSHNQIMDLNDGLFDATLNMKKLNLNFNKLTRISRLIFINLINLEKLTLSHNQLTTIEDSFRNMKLKEIDLQFNQLSNTERLFEWASNLEKLYLNNNNINNFSIANQFYIPNLQLIDLSQNNLQTFYYDDWMKTKRNLKIDLSYNNISVFKIKDFLQNSSYESYHLLSNINHNPIICDCNALELVQFYLDTRQLINVSFKAFKALKIVA
ncbi:unnamed protein product, partial [Diamesa hyperborea]